MHIDLVEVNLQLNISILYCVIYMQNIRKYFICMLHLTEGDRITDGPKDADGQEESGTYRRGDWKGKKEGRKKKDRSVGEERGIDQEGRREG